MPSLAPWDPNACFADLIKAFVSGDIHTASEHAEELNKWIDRALNSKPSIGISTR